MHNFKYYEAKAAELNSIVQSLQNDVDTKNARKYLDQARGVLCEVTSEFLCDNEFFRAYDEVCNNRYSEISSALGQDFQAQADFIDKFIEFEESVFRVHWSNPILRFDTISILNQKRHFIYDILSSKSFPTVKQMKRDARDLKALVCDGGEFSDFIESRMGFAMAFIGRKRFAVTGYAISSTNTAIGLLGANPLFAGMSVIVGGAFSVLPDRSSWHV